MVGEVHAFALSSVETGRSRCHEHDDQRSLPDE
jgi:hypothetical protein